MFNKNHNQTRITIYINQLKPQTKSYYSRNTKKQSKHS